MNPGSSNGLDPTGRIKMLPLIISLVAGAIGGNGAAAVMKNWSLGTAGNSIVGIIGGGIGGWLLGMMGAAPDAAATAAAASGTDMGAIIGQIVVGLVGGGVLLAVVGVVKGMMAKT